MSDIVVAFGGAQIPVNDLAVTLGYTAGFVTTQTVSYQGITYIQTFTRDGSGNTLAISQWIPQSGEEQEFWINNGLPNYINHLNSVLEKHKLTLPENKRNIGFLQDINKIGVAE